MAGLQLKPTYFNNYEAARKYLSNNKWFQPKDWDAWARKGQLDEYIAVLANTDKITDEAKFMSDYNYQFADDRTRVAALYNEVLADRTNTDAVRERYATDTQGNVIIQDNKPIIEEYKASDYDYFKNIIKQTNDENYQAYLRQQDQERKDSMNFFVKQLASKGGVIGEAVIGFTNQVDDLLNSIAAISNGLGALIEGKNPFDAAVNTMASDELRLFEQLGVQDWILDFERRFTYLRDLDGNYAGFGKIVGGVATTMGQMLPSMIAGKGVGKIAGVAGATVKTANNVSQAVSSLIFYQPMVSSNVRDMYKSFANKGVSVPSEAILANATIKAGLQYAVEIGLGKILGGTAIDNMVFGRTAGTKVSTTLSKATGSRLLHDFTSEGLEEVFQDTSDFLVDRAFSVIINENFGEITDLTYQGLIDSFIIGGLASFAGSALDIIKTKRKSIGFKTDENGKIIRDKNGNAVEEKLSKLASWEYGLNIDSFIRNFAELQQYTKRDENYAAAFTEMYAAFRMISSVYGEIGQERFEAANNILTIVTNLINTGKFNNQNAKIYSTKIYDLLSSLQEESLNNALKKLEEADITEVEEVVNKDNIDDVNIDDATKEEIKKLLTEGDINEVVTTDGTSPVQIDDKLFVNKKYVKIGADGVYQTLAEKRLVEAVMNGRYKGLPLDKVLDTFRKTIGKEDDNLELAVYNLLFNTDFFRIMLSTANKDMYQFLSSLLVAEKNAISKNFREDVYNNKIKIAAEGMKSALFDYCITQPFANEYIEIFTDQQIRKIKAARHCKNLAARIIDDNEYKKLSETDWNLLNNRVNAAPIRQAEKTKILNALHSTSAETRSAAMNRISKIYYGIFNSEYDGITYMPENSLGNVTFNTWLRQYGLTISTLQSEVDDAIIQIVTDLYGEFNENNLIDFRMEQFIKFTNNRYMFKFNRYNKIEIFEYDTQKQVGYSNYNIQVDSVTKGYNMNNRTTVERLQDRNKLVRDIVSDEIDVGTASYLSIQDIIADPSLLNEQMLANIKLKFGDINSETTFLYLRDYFINKLGDTTIVELQDGTHCFASVKNMKSLLKTGKVELKQSITDIKDIFKSELLYGRLRDIKIVVQSMDDGGLYDDAHNIIYIDKQIADAGSDYLTFAVLHEFQHAIQVENRMNMGISADWMSSKYVDENLKDDIVKDVKKHRPDLFKNAQNKKQEREIVQKFVYFSSGEAIAYGIEGSKLLDFSQTIITSNDKGLTVVRFPWGKSYTLHAKTNAHFISYVENSEVELTDEEKKMFRKFFDDSKISNSKLNNYRKYVSKLLNYIINEVQNLDSIKSNLNKNYVNEHYTEYSPFVETPNYDTRLNRIAKALFKEHCSNIIKNALSVLEYDEIQILHRFLSDTSIEINFDEQEKSLAAERLYDISRNILNIKKAELLINKNQKLISADEIYNEWKKYNVTPLMKNIGEKVFKKFKELTEKYPYQIRIVEFLENDVLGFYCYDIIDYSKLISSDPISIDEFADTLVHEIIHYLSVPYIMNFYDRSEIKVPFYKTDSNVHITINAFFSAMDKIREYLIQYAKIVPNDISAKINHNYYFSDIYEFFAGYQHIFPILQLIDETEPKLTNILLNIINNSIDKEDIFFVIDKNLRIYSKFGLAESYNYLLNIKQSLEKSIQKNYTSIADYYNDLVNFFLNNEYQKFKNELYDKYYSRETRNKMLLTKDYVEVLYNNAQNEYEYEYEYEYESLYYDEHHFYPIYRIDQETGEVIYQDDPNFSRLGPIAPITHKQSLAKRADNNNAEAVLRQRITDKANELVKANSKISAKELISSLQSEFPYVPNDIIENTANETLQNVAEELEKKTDKKETKTKKKTEKKKTKTETKKDDKLKTSKEILETAKKYYERYAKTYKDDIDSISDELTMKLWKIYPDVDHNTINKIVEDVLSHVGVILNELDEDAVDKRIPSQTKKIGSKKKDEKAPKRYVTQKEGAGTNLEKYGYTGKYKRTQLTPELKHFIVNATDKIDKKLWKAVTEGKISKDMIMHYFRNAATIDKATFKLINDSYFHNKDITSFDQLIDFVDNKTPKYYAMRALLKNLKYSDLLLENSSTNLLDKFERIIEHNPSLKQQYEKIRDRYDSIHGDSLSINPKNLRRLWMQYFDGSAMMGGYIASIAKIAAVAKWHIADDSDSSALDINAENIINTLRDEDAEAAFDMIGYSVDRKERVQIIMMIIGPKSIKKLLAKGRTFQQAKTAYSKYKQKLEDMSDEEFEKKYTEVVGNMSDEEINRLFATQLITDTADIDIEELSNKQVDKLKTVVEKVARPMIRPPRAVSDNIKGIASTIRRNLSQKSYKLFLKYNFDIFDDKLYIKKEVLKNENDEYRDKDELVKIEDRVRELSKDVQALAYVSERSLQMRNSLKKQIEQLNKKHAKEMKKIINETFKKVMSFEIGDDTITVNTDKQIPFALQRILENEFDKLAKSKTQYVIEGEEYYIQTSLKKFVANNAEFLAALTQSDVDEIIDFYLTSEILPSTNKAGQYSAIQIYLLSYLINGNKSGNFLLSDEQLKSVKERLKIIVSTSAKNLANWRAALELFRPVEEMYQSLAKKCDIQFRGQDEIYLIEQIQSGNVKAIQHAKKIMYDHALQDYKGSKMSFFDRLWKFERLAMLSSPGTWVRNVASNALLTGGNLLSEQIGDKVSKLIEKLFPKKKWRRDKQYKIIGTEVSSEITTFIKNELIDSGLLDLLKDGLSKYDTVRYRVGKADREDALVAMIKSSIRSAIFNGESLDEKALDRNYKGLNFKTKVQKFVSNTTTDAQNFVIKMLSDNKAIHKAAIRYFGKILAEDNVNVKNMWSADTLNHLAEAYKLAAYDYMHKPNIWNKIETAIHDKFGSGGFFVYKQVFPFASASWNWFLEGLNYTPVGLAMAIKNFVKLENTIDKMDKARDEGEKVISSRFAEYITRRNIGKGIIGSIGFGIGLLLAAFGIAGIDDEDDQYKLIIDIGDEHITVDISDIFGTQGILMGISLATSIRGQDDVLSIITATLDTMFLDSTFSEMANTFRYNTIGDIIVNMPINTLQAFVPNFVKTLSSVANIYGVKYSKGMLGKIERLAVSAVPILAYAFPKQMDPYTGETQVAYKLQFVTNLVNKLSPMKVYPYNISKLEKIATSLGVKAGSLTGEYKVNGTDVNLSTSDIQKVNEYYGKLNNAELSDFIANKTAYKVYDKKSNTYSELKYSKMTDEQKKTVIERIMSDNREIAKIYILTSTKGYKYYAKENEYKKLKSLKVTNIYKSNNKYNSFVK